MRFLRQRNVLPSGMLALAATLLAASALGSPSPAAALSLPPGFQAQTLDIPRAGEGGATVLTGLQKPTALDFAPDASLYVAERNGRVMSFDSVGDTSPTLVADLTRDVMAWGDRGLLGLKLDPEFPARPYLYLAYTHDAPIGGQAPSGTDDASGADTCVGDPQQGGCLSSGRIARLTLDLGTGVALGGPVNPAQNVLVEDWCQQFDSHSIGDIEFDSEGALLAGGGDGANWEVADNGSQFGNPCADPPLEGGSGRSQDLRTPGDPTGYNGSIVRVNRETGAPMEDNPLFSGSDVKARRIVAYGLRNPYRFELRPGTGEVYIGDVGWYNWEELDRISSPPAPGAGVPDFGWPCYEGPNPSFEWRVLSENEEAPLCKSLYAAGPTAVIGPWFRYLHSTDVGLYPGDGCQPLTGASVSGLGFYEGVSGLPENVFPASYDGALFIADASRGCLWTMRPGPSGAPDPATVTVFGTAEEGDPHPFTPVDVVVGPEGALYLPNFFDDSIVRIRYFANGQPPIASLEADRSFGSTASGPLEIAFDASASTDPGGGAVHYSWDLDGDSAFGEGPDAPTVEAEYEGEENVNVGVRVSDGDGNADEAHMTVFPGDLGPPEPLIDVSEDEWSVGDHIPFSATADDPDLEIVEMDWEVTIRHCPSACHGHPLTSFSGVDSGEIIAPPHEYPSHLQLTLTARDQRGLATTVSRQLFPRPISVELRSEPAGVPLNFNTINAPAPFVGTMISGGNGLLSAPAATTLQGAGYEFVRWSDGGARSHSISPTAAVSLTATYRRLEGPPPSDPGPPPSPGLASWRLCSRPGGVPLGVGDVTRRAPFSLELAAGQGSMVAAPRRAKVRKRTLVFKRWSNGGKRRQWLAAAPPATLCAVYRPENSHRRAHR